MKRKILTCVAAVVLFLVLAYGFVPQVLGGKIVNQSDISGWQGMAKEMMDWNSAHPDDQTAWTESMFGGMPTATIHASTKGDWTQPLYDLLLVGRRPATYLFISLLGAWLLMLALGMNPIIAAGGAIAVTFCSYNFQIIQVGHNTKMQALAFLPWVLAALVFTYRSCLKDRKKWLPLTALGAALFALALSFQVKANHPQITYYLALMILIYAIALFISIVSDREKRKDLGRFFAASGLLLVFGCAGIATNATKLLPTYEYTPYSMRGGSSSADATGDGSKGLKLDYATAWSYGWEELPNLMIPNFNGGASSGAVNPDRSATCALLREVGQPNMKELAKALPLYWGPQPFTAGPMYMGAITIFLFLLGLMLCKGREKWWLVAATVLAVFLGLGSNFMWFTKLFYDFAPLYNKFRTVSMALVVLQFTLPMLAFTVLDRIVKGGVSVQDYKKPCWIALALSAGFCLLVYFFPTIAGTFTGDVDSKQFDALVDALISDRIVIFRQDALRSFLLICAASALIWWGLRAPKGARATFATQPEAGFARRRTAAILVCLLVLVDLFAVGKRYLNADDFVSPKAFKSQFNQRPADKYILQDTDPSYRVLDLTVNVFNDSHPSYWHKNIGGYSPAKLQRYQEYIDSRLSSEISKLYTAIGSAETVAEAEAAMPYLEGLARLNCKYVIISEDIALEYPHAAGTAWFESGEGDVEMTSYAPNCLEYRYSSAAGGTLVFSEVYYPQGWTLKLDGGEELPISLYGDLFRSAQVPAGEHTLVMRFEPKSYAVGEGVSRASSIFIILIVLLSVAGAVLTKKKEWK